MLKIKDNIDLKELEKFGFIFYHYVDKHDYYVFPDSKDTELSVFIETRQIYAESYLNNLDKLYDLIQAGLVEKVSN